ncbi:MULTISPECIES: fimbrial protein [Enterobacter]|uniref:Fimbrial protein n=1 Tax=Enterobacter rongchengensis TaxID=3030999 RepID=A0ABV4JD36_9ENTR|nr:MULTISPECIES: fimbrial protein [Enterobacter]PNL54518.1 type 1 fimbrial protein [Enterobacter hormaechei]HCR0842224.1 type 1 fimbrial protein [Enterobacter cancerogenus]EKX4010200.1 type 1 fimbrial protein [Enterobacter cloacae]ELV3042035.1 type 1 fimbrial protein [Enterobacter chengduensis]KLQ18316.1 ferrous iron transporter B [Enterobacter chengduensis]
MQLVKQCFFLLVLATASLFVPHAKATCTSPDLPKMINVSSISVSSTLPVGATIPGTEQTVHISGNCYNPADYGLPIVACYYGSGTEIPGLSGVYESGIEGVGVALMNDKGQRITGAGGVYCNSTATPLGYVSDDVAESFSFDATLELVKTSDTVKSGSLSQAASKFGVGVYQHEGISDPNTISYSGNVNLQNVTCSVLPKTLTVNIGDFPVSDFISVGTLSMPDKKFNITVNCNANVQPEFKVTSSNGYVPGYEGVIKLTPENGVATGVGVRMVIDNALATFDTYTPTESMAYANQTLDIPVILNYLQVADEVTPGPANAVATITLAYK